MVTGEAVGDPRAAVVAGDGEPLEAERRHRLDLILGQGTLRIIDVIRPSRRLRAVAVAAQIGDHDSELDGEARSQFAPHQMGLRVAVQQQERRSGAPGHQVDARARCLDLAKLETRKEIGHHRSR